MYPKVLLVATFTYTQTALHPLQYMDTTGLVTVLQNPQRHNGVALVPSPIKTTWVKVAVDQTTLPMEQMVIEVLSMFATKARKEPLGVTQHSLAEVTQYIVLRTVVTSSLTRKKGCYR